MNPTIIFCHNRDELFNIGVIKQCMYCKFETLDRTEIRRHGIDLHNNKNCQYNDKQFQMEARK